MGTRQGNDDKIWRDMFIQYLNCIPVHTIPVTYCTYLHTVGTNFNLPKLWGAIVRGLEDTPCRQFRQTLPAPWNPQWQRVNSAIEQKQMSDSENVQFSQKEVLVVLTGFGC